jgi:hypothetical protein
MGQLGKIDDPVSLSFALPHEQPVGAQVKVLELKVNQFAGAQSSVRQDGQASVFQARDRIGSLQTTAEVDFELLAFPFAQMAWQGIWPRQGPEAKETDLHRLALIRQFV